MIVGAGCVAVTSCAGTGTEKPDQPSAASSQNARTPRSSPTPSTSAEVASAVRASLRQLGTGTATLVSGSGSQKVTQHLTVSCDSAEPRQEFTARIPGRGDEPATVKFTIITSGSKYYVRRPKDVRSDPAKPWKEEKLSGMVSEIDTTFHQSTLNLYAANCDQPVALARAAKPSPDPARPHTVKGTLKVADAAKFADGYAARFYRYGRSFGATKLKYTLRLGADYQPLSYRIVSDGAHAEAASWSVTFSGWHAPQIQIPPKDQIE